ncbi:tryptophan halogenase family protein [Rubrivivax albus]|uniref:Tryptophan 7-halogenase n=1 Tax=Rubrivivax albus TaxID=2499835 RepID=A0A3S3S8U4_9BURK|nr:tryptophan halogenase family protein [Rubrivivax albus]RVT48456.1 tryptophan 7-halogenase [Rubrivivax albus]
MGDTRLKKVLIVGGGTAGWMSAAVLVHSLGRQYEVQLIESDEISTVGVGEATIPSIIRFNDLIGIDENEFMRRTQATFKLGIQFRNWGAQGDAYIHGFGSMGRKTGLVDFHHYWLKAFQAGRVDRLDDYSINLLACETNRFSRADPSNPNSPLADIRHAFHFDAGLYARYLRGYCEQRGVTRTEGRIDSVQVHPETGFVTSVTMANGDVHAADLFIDCSGFRGLLIEQTLRTGYDDWSHWLPCDSALAVPCESVEPLLPYTRATAHGAGWQWRIPLQHRIGNGHVFCSRFMSQDEATAILLGNLDGKALAEPRLIRFTTGKRKKFWHKNVVAIGLASGFIEPLESTSIHLIQQGIVRLVELFPSQGFLQADIDEYNQQSTTEFEQVRDFIVLHYHATQRRDTPFWEYCATMDVPDTLRRKIDLFRANGRFFRQNDELFNETSWVQVMFGQGIRPQGYHPLADNTADEPTWRMLDNVRTVMHRVVERMPTHAQYIAQHCKAAAG